MLVLAASARIFILAFFIITTLGKQQTRKPRVICALKKDNICVNWAVYGVGKMSQSELTAVEDDCQQKCKDKGQACEAKVVSVDTWNYRCVPFCKREECREAFSGKVEL
ncbi:uncharacterized protein MYCGRDRAFT_90092 [Zymoseptoria tritici IPO323]|uniref:Apple domain-containing protein n=3 Tax=Zymoseptoria tritici TaxID=1047171 RepID=F9WX54_ZYMTI|nr:uncharacterized protein MYCGRDRAFT_90092 [Zymoseptoria tritici IPO323]EGP91953.1 hypothetical protein MYCGRDRAFT_90092 [Zymoseptoria tritici IPO323]